MSDVQNTVENLENPVDEYSDQYLTFVLEGEEFAIDILRVQEIKSWDKATNLPGSPYYVEGAINLRGTIVPIIDLRKRFNLPEIDFDYTTVVIVVKVLGDERDRIMGIIVDAVSDVHSLAQSSIRPAPDMKGKLDSQFVTGLTTINDKMVIVMDIDALMNSDELVLETEEA
ncbi:MAG: chemotaxis protein CheW [gamma proteobacterium symbiont of Taylorina sp.]|nr:chemotaxis protein CheW [gamma proteobacterium symbiont of Taylorina sp.]